MRSFIFAAILAAASASIVESPEDFYPKPLPLSKVPEMKRFDIRLARDNADAAEKREKAALAKLADAAELDTALRYAEEARKERALKYKLYNDALRMTVDAFGLRPPVADFSQAAGLLPAARSIEPWRPRYSEQEKYDEERRAWRQRRPSEKAGSKAPSALTWDTGRISMFSDGFQGEPRDIAIVIYHETIHWVMRVADAALKRSPEIEFALESKTHELTADYAASLARPDAEANSRRWAADYARRSQAARGKTWDQLLISHPDWVRDFRDSRPFGLGVPDEYELLAALDRSASRLDLEFYDTLSADTGEDTLRAYEDNRAASVKRLEEQALERAQEAERRRRLERYEANEKASVYLAAMARLACRDPQTLADEGRRGRVRMVSVDPDHLEDYLGRYPAGNGLSPCQVELLRKVLKGQDAIALADLIALGVQWRADHPTLLEKIGRALEEFFSAMDQHGGGSGAGGGGPGEPREPGEPEDRGGNVPDHIPLPPDPFARLVGVR